MKAIEKAWKENLKLQKDEQWETKEDLIENCCPHGEFYLKLKGFKNDDELCSCYDEDCARCWNTEIEEDNIEKSALTFEQLKSSLIEGLGLNDYNENCLINSLKDDDTIIYTDDSRIKYKEIPEVIKYLQDIYTYTTELKEKSNIEYVDFIEAKTYMNEGFKAEFEDEVYYIKDNELYCEDLKSACALKLRAIESDKWILL